MANVTKVPDLLPWNLTPKVVLSPERILAHQAELIGTKSEGRLFGKLKNEETEKGVNLDFIVEASLLDYSTRLFSCTHDRFLMYPTIVFFSGFETGRRKASSEQQFRSLISEIFDHDSSRAIFESLLARIGESEEAANEIKEA